MAKQLFIIPPFILIVLSLAGCRNDDSGQGPQMTLTGANLSDNAYTIDDSGDIRINVLITSTAGFSVLRITFDGLDEEEIELLATESGQQVFEHDFILEDITFPSQPFVISFTAVDNTNSSTRRDIEVQADLPTVVLTDENDEIENGMLVAFVDQEFALSYRYTFPGGFNQLRIVFSEGTSQTESIINSLPPTQGSSASDVLRRTLDQGSLGMELSYFFELTDNLGEQATLTVPVVLSQKAVAFYNAILLAAPSSDRQSKSFFSSGSGLSFSVTEVNEEPDVLSSLIDFGYYHSQTDGASFAGPANYPTSIYNLGPNGEDWQSLNVVNFRMTDLTESEFSSFTDDSQAAINEAYDAAIGMDQLVISNLEVGNIIAFKTDNDKENGSKKGVFRVISHVEGESPIGQIEFAVATNR